MVNGDLFGLVALLYLFQQQLKAQLPLQRKVQQRPQRKVQQQLQLKAQPPLRQLFLRLGLLVAKRLMYILQFPLDILPNIKISFVVLNLYLSTRRSKVMQKIHPLAFIMQ